MANNNGIAIIGTNNDTIDFNNPESEEIAKGILINQILRSKADTEVYPVLGSTFSEVKKRSLAFGLDLVGGMSVTLEVSEPEFVKSQVKNQNDISFTSPYEKALVKYENDGTRDFIDLFVAEFRKENGSLMLNTIFYGEKIEITTSDDEVIKARAILSAWQNALGQGKGVAELDGQLIENLHAEEAERVVIFADALARRTKV